jgi:hypothetical protein
LVNKINNFDAFSEAFLNCERAEHLPPAVELLVLFEGCGLAVTKVSARLPFTNLFFNFFINKILSGLNFRYPFICFGPVRQSGVNEFPGRHFWLVHVNLFFLHCRLALRLL